MRSRPISSIGGSQRVQVHVALEGVDQPRLAALGDHQVARLGAGVLDVGTRGVEVGVVGHHVARPGDGAEQDVLGGAALVRGDHVLEAGDVLHRGLEPVERSRARIRLVAGDHARPLARRHGAGAAVGQQVDQHVLGLEQERIVAGLCEQRLDARPRVVKRIGSTERTRNGSMMVCGWKSSRVISTSCQQVSCHASH